MRSQRIDVADRLRRLHHPDRLSLGDAAQRLGVPEGHVAEALASPGGMLPGGGTHALRMTNDAPDRLITELSAGGPVVISVAEHGIGGWRLAHALSVSVEHPTLRVRWDQAELVLPFEDLHTYAIVEPATCRCGERRAIAWYDASGRSLARFMPHVDSDPAAYTRCVANRTNPVRATWAEPGPTRLPPPSLDRQWLPAGILPRIVADISQATALPSLTTVLGHERYLLAQHASPWIDRSSGRTTALSDGMGCVHLWLDAVADVAIVQVPSAGPLHAIEAYDVTGQRCLAIVPQRALDGCDPGEWTALIDAWQVGAW